MFVPSDLSDFIQLIRNLVADEIIISRVQNRPWQSSSDVNKTA